MLPEAGKTPTTSVQGADLVAAVDGGNRDVDPNSTPSQGLHVSSSTNIGHLITCSKAKSHKTICCLKGRPYEGKRELNNTKGYRTTLLQHAPRLMYVYMRETFSLPHFILIPSNQETKN